MPTKVQFPDNFIWGAATSSYQIEGSPLADGAGKSIWHRFAHTPGRVAYGHTGDIACDHYNRYPEDVQLMGELGLQSYRFSIAWARLFPEGKGRINEKGFDFYKRLLDELLKANIDPMITLYHWDLPLALNDQGGWLNPDSAQWFADYAQTVFERFDDRVDKWVTLNEPWVVTDGGYMHGSMAPGHSSQEEAAIAGYNIMHAHAEAVRRYRSVGKNKIGLVVNLEPKYPASQSPEDLKAVDRADAYMNRQFLDPALLGHYPEELEAIFGDAWPNWGEDKVKLLQEDVDFIGLNYYTRSVTAHKANNWPLDVETIKQEQSTYTETGWEVCPKALQDILLWVKDRYNNPDIYITENGSAFYDPPTANDDRVHDPLRCDYLRTHLSAISDAISQGCNVKGYYAWSLLDNFEWAHGYSKRFGIIHVDYQTQKRTLKDSARLYQEIIASNGKHLNQ